MSRRRRHSRYKPDTELNITAFMNLMVVLVPFLLLMAVFTRLTVIELALPGPLSDVEEPPEDPPIELEVVIRENRIDIQDRGSALLGEFPRVNGKDDYKPVIEKLRQVKAQFPDIISASILAEDDVPYDRIVQVMEVMRSYNTEGEQGIVQEELFPEISLGKATVLDLPEGARDVVQPYETSEVSQ